MVKQTKHLHATTVKPPTFHQFTNFSVISLKRGRKLASGEKAYWDLSPPRESLTGVC